MDQEQRKCDYVLYQAILSKLLLIPINILPSFANFEEIYGIKYRNNLNHKCTSEKMGKKLG